MLTGERSETIHSSNRSCPKTSQSARCQLLPHESQHYSAMTGILQRFKRHPKQTPNLQRCTNCTCRLGSVTCATAQSQFHNCKTMSNTMQLNIRVQIKSRVSNLRGPLSVYLVMCMYMLISPVADTPPPIYNTATCD